MGRIHGKGAGTVVPENGDLMGKIRERTSSRPSTSPGEAAVVGRHGRKRSKEWSNEHLLKADELDGIYATQNYAHGERRSMELPPQRSIDGGMGFDANVVEKMGRDEDFDESLGLKDCIVPAEISRGRFYERYMQRREAKMRKEWGLGRDLKIAKMKALEERLEESRADMEAVFSRSSSRYGDAMLANRRVEKLKSFAGHAMGNKAEASAGKGSVEMDNGKGRYNRKITSGGKSLSRTVSNSFGSSGSISSPTTPRTPTATSRSFSRYSTGAGKHMKKLEKSAGHPVSNIPDLKRNNDKPPNGIGIAASHVQPRIYALRRSTGENASPIKEERKSHQPLTPRKKAINSVECKDLTPKKVAISSLKPPQENPVHRRVQRVIQPRSSHTKGRGAPPVGRNCTPKKRDMASLHVRDEGLKGLLDQQDSPSNMVVENENIKEESFEINVDQVESSSSMVKEEQQQLEIMSAKEVKEIHEEKSEFGTVSEMGEVPSNAPMQIDSSSAMIVIACKDGSSAETKEVLPTSQNNTHVHNSLSSVKEPSDVKSFEFTPVSSTAELHAHPSYLTMKDDSTWITAENPGISANTPRHTPKRDLAKTIRRLLNFGRKRRESGKLAKNQLSASINSEREYDMEENHQLTNQLSDEVGKSRLVFSQHHYVRNDSIEVTNLHDQGRRSEGSTPVPESCQMRVDNTSRTLVKAPRPFLSLAAFRSKGCI